MPIAILADVHANLPALEAVLENIAAAGVDARCALGDLVRYAPWPNEVLERLRAEGFPIVMGNYDDGFGYDRDECGCAYVKERDKAEGDAGFAWTKAQMTDENKAWLRTLHPQIRFEADGRRYLLVHGSPRRINEYIYEDKPDATFARLGEMADAEIIVCGHTHKAYDKTVDGWRFVNVGTAGRPKDGDPRGCWALLDTSTGEVEFRRTAYDVERAARSIEATELPAEFAAQFREARGYR